MPSEINRLKTQFLTYENALIPRKFVFGLFSVADLRKFLGTYSQKGPRPLVLSYVKLPCELR